MYATGNLTLQCAASFTVDFCRILRRHNEEYNPFHLITASFTGTTTDNGGTLQITEATLDVTTFQADRFTSFDDARSEYLVNLDSTSKIIKNCIYERWDAQGNRGLAGPKGNWIIVGKMTFPFIGEATINYESVNHGDTISAIWGLTNLQFAGCERHAGNLDLDSFTINIDRRKFIIYHVDDYKQKIEQLKSTEGVDITANVTVATRYSELPKVEFTLEKACVLLSFATMNWVTPLFKDIFKDRRLTSTTLLGHFTLPFKKAYHVIDTRNRDYCPLRRFVGASYDKYAELENIFRLRFVIEYYISAARPHSPEDQFVIAYLALDCLASNAPKYAKKRGKKLENPNAVSSKEAIINAILEKRKQTLPTKVIREIADAVAYKQIGDQIKIEYLIDEFEVEFDKATVDAIISFRGEFMHTGIDKTNEAWKHYQNILGIIERTLLTMLGWKGNEYVDKLSSFTVKTLN